MTFDEALTQVREVLEREGRVSYRALKRRFGLDDDYLEDVKDELIKAKQLARDEDGAVLVWTGGTTVVGSQLSVPSSPPPLTSTLAGRKQGKRARGQEAKQEKAGDQARPRVRNPP